VATQKNRGCPQWQRKCSVSRKSGVKAAATRATRRQYGGRIRLILVKMSAGGGERRAMWRSEMVKSNAATLSRRVSPENGGVSAKRRKPARRTRRKNVCLELISCGLDSARLNDWRLIINGGLIYRNSDQLSRMAAAAIASARESTEIMPRRERNEISSAAHQLKEYFGCGARRNHRLLAKAHIGVKRKSCSMAAKGGRAWRRSATKKKKKWRRRWRMAKWKRISA